MSPKVFSRISSSLSALAFTFLLSLPQYLHAQSGALDTTFNPGTGVNSSVYSIALQTNGQILIAGDFTSFNDVERVNVARLNADGSRDDGFDVRGVPARPNGGRMPSDGDHRIAMLGAVAGVFSRDGVEVEGAEAVAISFPGFFDLLNSVSRR